MMQTIKHSLHTLDHRLRVLIAARLISQIGNGFTLFYLPVFFSTRVGLSATQVGFGIGLGSLAGILGRVLGGSLSDWSAFGRRRTLLVSGFFSSLGTVGLALAANLFEYLGGSAVLGFGIGLFWPATEAFVADVTTPDTRNIAYAYTRVCDTLGIGSGVLLGGWALSTIGSYRLLFFINAGCFVMFIAVLFFALHESGYLQASGQNAIGPWKSALTDRRLLLFITANIIFTSQFSQIVSTLPLYFSRLSAAPGENSALSLLTFSSIFAGYTALTAILQMPVAHFLNRLTSVRALKISAWFWSAGFLLIWLSSRIPEVNFAAAIAGMVLLALATVAYLPSASTLVASLATASQRGVYLSLNSLCWPIGYFIGPALGGLALDTTGWFAENIWLWFTAASLLALLLLTSIELAIKHRTAGMGERVSLLPVEPIDPAAELNPDACKAD